MTELQRTSLGEQNVEQAITALKRGSYLLKYGRRGKPKFCPFRLSKDETTLIWYVGKEEKKLRLSHVSRIMPGQRTAIFQRYPRPEKEYQSFSLIYDRRSLDVICKDKDEAEIWFVGLRALISRNNCKKWRSAASSSSISTESSSAVKKGSSQSMASSSCINIVYKDFEKNQSVPLPVENTPQKKLGRAFSDFLLYREGEDSPQNEFVSKSFSSQSSGGLDDQNDHSSADSSRFSLSSAISSSSLGSPVEDFESLHDVFIWGQGIGDGLLGGGVHRIGKTFSARMDAFLPKVLESTMVLDTHSISCGSRHAILVTKQGEIYSWGEGSGGRLGHGVEADLSAPKIINGLSGLNIESVACGESHTCAITRSGDLYTWGDGIHNFGLLGHGNEISHWTPKRVRGPMDGLHVSYIACGPWHSAAVTSEGLLFTFGDGTFGALGHGNCSSTCGPRMVEALKGLRTIRVACGVWHTAAIVEVSPKPLSLVSSSIGKLFTWGNGDKGQLGHGDKEPRFLPTCVALLIDNNFCQVACGHSMTIALTALGQVYTMGSADYGQLGNPENDGKLPMCIKGKLGNGSVEEIACGSYHVAVLNSKSEVYTWGKGTNGQLGHGDNEDRNTPTLVEALMGNQVKSVMCGSNFTVALCLHKRVCIADQSICSGCRAPFTFRKKRHNCYNCGLVFCTACSSKKSSKASLAPNLNKLYRVCEDCYIKLNKDVQSKTTYRPPKVTRGNIHCKSGQMKDQKSLDHKPRGFLYRLSSFDYFKHVENMRLKEKGKNDSSNGHGFSCQSGRIQRALSYTSNTSNSSPSTFEYCEGKFPSVPDSTMGSQPASPVSLQSSSYWSTSPSSASVSIPCPEVIMCDQESVNDNFNKEISVLREQVEVLSHRARLLETELERTSKQLKDANEQARVEGDKNKAAKEVIKSLSNQLEDMTIRIGQGSSFCRLSGSCSGSPSNTFRVGTTWSQLTS